MSHEHIDVAIKLMRMTEINMKNAFVTRIINGAYVKGAAVMRIVELNDVKEIMK